MKNKPESPGSVLKEARVAEGLSYRNLATTTGMSVGYIYKVENNQITTPTHDMIGRFSDALHMDEDAVALSFGLLPEDCCDFIKGQPKEAAKILRRAIQYRRRKGAL